jgi:hypothetical protein
MTHAFISSALNYVFEHIFSKLDISFPTFYYIDLAPSEGHHQKETIVQTV